MQLFGLLVLVGSTAIVSVQAAPAAQQSGSAETPIFSREAGVRQIATPDNLNRIQGAFDGKTPATNDRKNLLKIRCPKPMSNRFARQMNINGEILANIRQREAKWCDFVRFVNEKHDDYVSPSALVHRQAGIARMSVAREVPAGLSQDEARQAQKAIEEVVDSYASFQRSGQGSV